MKRDHDPWLPPVDVRITAEGRLEAEVLLDKSSPWFSGHFDGMPVLPGVAFLALAGETVVEYGRKESLDLEITGFAKVRFKRFVFPGEELCVSVAAMQEETRADLDFLLSVKGEMVARGIMQVCRHSGRT